MGIETDNPFERVLDRLREKGWHQGSYFDDDKACLLGAASREGFHKLFSSSPDSDNSLLVGIVRTQYPDRVNGEMSDIPNFNDHPDTTFTDVERVLEKAAVKWEEERVMRND